MKHINRGPFLAFPVPIPPLAEQRRIVAEIETQLTRLDAAMAALKRSQANLKRYRASVLKAAVEGRLGNDPDSLDRSDSTYPSHWKIMAVEDLASSQPRSIQSGPFGSSLLHSEFQNEGVLAIGIDNVLDGKFSSGREHRISLEKFKELERYQARGHDVLITVMATIGRTCVVPEDIETSIITKHVYRISLNKQLILPHFLVACIRGSTLVRNQLFGSIHGQTRPGINGSVIRALQIPVPTIEEQREIIAELDRRLSNLDAMEISTAKALVRGERLRQAILRKAFSGELVPQDPNDEPASILLKSIRTKQQPNQSNTREKGSKRKANSSGSIR